MDSERLFQGFFRGKKVLVTGHTGFKGSWLTAWLVKLGAGVTGYSLEPPTDPSLFEQCKLAKHIRSMTGDIRDLEKLTKAVATAKPEIVFHLAAQSLVRRSYRDPVETVATNVLGTAHVLEAIRRKGAAVKVCQVITSDKCYANRETGHAYTEEDPVGGHDPYSASKGAAELVVASFRKSFFPPESMARQGVSLSSVRAGNVIGGGDWSEDRIFPDCVRALSKKKPVLVRNPESVRPWQYVLDALSGYLALAARQADGEAIYASAWNFGPEAASELKVADFTDKVIRYWGSGSWVPGKPKASAADEKLHEAKLLKLDCSKAHQLLTWHPVYTVDEAIEQTVLWYRSLSKSKRFNAYDFTLNQIDHYVSKAKGRGLLWTMQQPKPPR
ncbi:MAG: CDP-glucose 4,6-dehydratase [Candidatus Omnitrophica bacterium]|nr:CDP-glucose 4,6-dehydratase [Candidatus Omnitrophota bacterium]